MTTEIRIGTRRFGPVALLAGLAAVALVVAILTPESAQNNAGESRSTHSTGPAGARMVYELAERMGWRVSRRESLIDSVAAASRETSVQVVLAPEQALGAVEVHRLLENVRRGGGLIFDVDEGPEIADSLGLEVGRTASGLYDVWDARCGKDSSFFARSAFAFPVTIRPLRWRRPAPGPITSIVAGERDQPDINSGKRPSTIEVAQAFPLGAGGVVAVSSSVIFSNIAVRTCGWGVDVAAVRALEFVRPPDVARPRMVFDEYHHGYGTHGGSMKAVSLYLGHTASGHFLAQGLIAALILLLAKAPRPIVPKDPERIARRSPLEHADALAHAYSDVAATKTATARLVAGLRRRAGRTVAVAASVDDNAFLDAVARRTPELAAPVSVVRRALDHTVPPRDFTAVGDAIGEIERRLTTSAPTPTTS